MRLWPSSVGNEIAIITLQTGLSVGIHFSRLATHYPYLTESLFFLGSSKMTRLVLREKAEVVGISYADIRIESIEWLWEGKIPLGQISMLVSDPGVGKSTLSLLWAAHVSQGRPWPDGADCPIGTTWLITTEDHPNAIIKPRLVAAGAELEKVMCFKGLEKGVPFDLKTRGIDTFEQMWQRDKDLKMIVMDPVASYMGDIDSHNNSDVRAVLDPIADWAAKRGVAILMIHHLNKNENYSPIHRAMGSTAFVAIARMVWSIKKDAADPDLRIMSLVKGNIAETSSKMGFRMESVIVPGFENECPIETSKINWDKKIFKEMKDKETLSSEIIDSLQYTQKRAARWLVEILKGGELCNSAVWRLGRIAGFTKPTIRRAKSALGEVVHCYPKKDISELSDGSTHWYWALRGPKA